MGKNFMYVLDDTAFVSAKVIPRSYPNPETLESLATERPLHSLFPMDVLKNIILVLWNFHSGASRFERKHSINAKLVRCGAPPFTHTDSKTCSQTGFRFHLSPVIPKCQSTSFTLYKRARFNDKMRSRRGLKKAARWSWHQ